MQNIWNQTAMAIASGAIRLRYVGRLFDFASIVVAETGGTDASPTISLGVSNTSLADAVTNDELVFTSTDGSDLMNDIINTIRWWKTTTADRGVESGDFECVAKDCLGNSTTDTPYHATAAKFAGDNGTDHNYGDGDWHDTMHWDSDADSTGHVTLRLPEPRTSKGGVVIAHIYGEATVAAGTVLSSGLTRFLYDDDGNQLYSSGAQTVIGNVNVDWRTAPHAYNGPIIIRDQATTPGDNDCDATTAVAIWDIARNPL